MVEYPRKIFDPCPHSPSVTFRIRAPAQKRSSFLSSSRAEALSELLASRPPSRTALVRSPRCLTHREDTQACHFLRVLEFKG
jgi:hypothetical protein